MQVVAVLEDIRDFLNGAAEDRAGRRAFLPWRHGISGAQLPGHFWRVPMRGPKMDKLPIELEDMTELGFAEACHALCNRIEHWLHIGR